MPKLVDSKDDILNNIRTFNEFRGNTADGNGKFYARKLRNCSYFIVHRSSSQCTFTPANFAGYKDSTAANGGPLTGKIKSAISKIIGHGECDDRNIDELFYKHCSDCGAIKKTERKEPLRYWVIDKDVADTFDDRVRAAEQLADEDLLQRALRASHNQPKRRWTKASSCSHTLNVPLVVCAIFVESMLRSRNLGSLILNAIM